MTQQTVQTIIAELFAAHSDKLLADVHAKNAQLMAENALLDCFARHHAVIHPTVNAKD